YETNVLGGLRVAQACVNSGVKHMIFSSTAAVYGEANREASTEDDSIHPMTPYGASKWMVEEILKKIGEECAYFQWISLRYFNVSGASLDGKNGQRTKNATHLVKVAAEAAAGKRSSLQIFGTDYPTEDGTCVRDFIHVEDLARAHVMALESLNENHH